MPWARYLAGKMGEKPCNARFCRPVKVGLLGDLELVDSSQEEPVSSDGMGIPTTQPRPAFPAVPLSGDELDIPAILSGVGDIMNYAYREGSTKEFHKTWRKMADFVDAIKNISKSVSQENLREYERWMKEFGCV